MNYEQAMNEISINELKDMPMYQRIQQQLVEKHDAEKEGVSVGGWLCCVMSPSLRFPCFL